jgi:rhomboid family GlyGly-CTERM serine protease
VQPPPVPYLTLGVAVASVGLWLAPELGEALIYRRDLVAGGEVWRLLTAPLVHLSASHLAWNLAVFLWAAAACERRCPQRLGGALGASALLPGLWALGWQPELAVYGGLSALATAAVVLLAVHELCVAASPPLARGLWAVVLALAVAKPLTELGLQRPLFAGTELGGWRPLPAAHLLGALSGLWAATTVGRRRRPELDGVAPPSGPAEIPVPGAR